MSGDGSSPLPDASSLIEAFKLFNQTSQELTEAYGTLQQEVQRLSAELAEANCAPSRRTASQGTNA
jgi:hypothetical protein